MTYNRLHAGWTCTDRLTAGLTAWHSCNHASQ